MKLQFVLIPFFDNMLIAQVYAQTTQPWSSTVCTQEGVATIQGVQCLMANILSIAITAIGFAGFIMLIIGAFNYLLSGGNSKGMETARNTITFAVIGLVVALSSFIILNLISDFTGIESILKFNVPSSND